MNINGFLYLWKTLRTRLINNQKTYEIPPFFRIVIISKFSYTQTRLPKIARVRYIFITRCLEIYPIDLI